MSDIKFDEMKGKGVLSQDGREFGSVDDLVLDHEAWHVTALVVKLERELLEQFGMKKPMFGTTTIELNVDLVSGIGDKVILHKSLADLTDIYRDKGKDPAED